MAACRINRSVQIIARTLSDMQNSHICPTVFSQKSVTLCIFANQLGVASLQRKKGFPQSFIKTFSLILTHPCTPYTAATRSTAPADTRPQQTRRHQGERQSKQRLSGLHTARRCGDRLRLNG
jgi:hypothetical protein